MFCSWVCAATHWFLSYSFFIFLVECFHFSLGTVLDVAGSNKKQMQNEKWGERNTLESCRRRFEKKVVLLANNMI